MILETLEIRGVEMHYYAVCKRKLWLFQHGLGMEQHSDRVEEGKVLHDYAYGRLDKEIEIGGEAVVDAIDEEWVREVKISSRMERADRLQMLYYLYLLKQNGIEKKGLLSYPTEKQTVEVELDEAAIQEVEASMQGVRQIGSGTLPKYRKLPYCAKCAYRDFCQSGEIGEEEA